MTFWLHNTTVFYHFLYMHSCGAIADIRIRLPFLCSVGAVRSVRNNKVKDCLLTRERLFILDITGKCRVFFLLCLVSKLSYLIRSFIKIIQQYIKTFISRPEFLNSTIL